MWAKVLNSSGHVPFARSPSQSQNTAKPVLVFIYTYCSSARYILSKGTHRISRRNDTFHTQFPKLTSICCKFSCVEEHVTKYHEYCYYVMLDRIGHAAKYSRTCIWDYSTVFAMCNVLGCHELCRAGGVPGAKHGQHNPS